MYDYDRAVMNTTLADLKARFPNLYEQYKHFVEGSKIEIVNNYSTIKIRVMKGNNLVVDGFKGSFGQITATAAKDGDRILKQKIQNMTNPNTALQQGARSNFSTMSKIGSAINPFLRENFNPTKVLHSPYNSFTSINTPRKPEGGGNTPALDVDTIQFTNGSLYHAEITYDAAETADNGDGTHSVVCDWVYDANSSIYEGTDEVFYFVFEKDTSSFIVLQTPDTRSDGTASVDVTQPASGESLIVAFFKNTSTGEVSSAKAFVKLSSAGVFTAL